MIRRNSKFARICKSEVVRAWDVRDVSDQVHSMGAKWVTVDFKAGL